MKTRWMKPEYCTSKKLSCEDCENFTKEDKTCLLTEEHVKILDNVITKEKLGGKFQR